MRKKPFSKEEIEQLEANPHTAQVTRHRLQLTVEAKRKVMEMRDAGYTARKIIRELGYDTEVLGQSSIDGIVCLWDHPAYWMPGGVQDFL